MNQTICDACGNVIKVSENHQSNMWDMSGAGTAYITKDNLDICSNCWEKISKKGVSK